MLPNWYFRVADKPSMNGKPYPPDAPAPWVGECIGDYAISEQEETGFRHGLQRH
jgi:hypothetical protein